MNHDRTAALSPAGAARRDAMLAELLEQMTTVHRRRRGRRRAVASFALLLALAAVAWIQPLRPERVGSPAPGPRAAMNSGHAPPRAPIAMIATDPSVVSRLRADPSPLVRVVDDEALLEMLAELGRPAGLIVFAGSVRPSAAVTDADLGLDHAPGMPESG